MRGHKLILSMLCVTLLSGITGLSQAAHADSGWMSILVEPLLKSVVGPALEKGVDTLQAKYQKKHAEPQSAMYELQVTAEPDREIMASDWALPEEPMH